MTISYSRSSCSRFAGGFKMRMSVPRYRLAPGLAPGAEEFMEVMVAMDVEVEDGSSVLSCRFMSSRPSRHSSVDIVSS